MFFKVKLKFLKSALFINISMPLFCVKMHTSHVFRRHVYKNDLNVLIELWPNPGLG